jgi:ribosomal-protein-alanine N-acetyltransferase
MRDAEVNRFIPVEPPASIAALEATFARRIAGGAARGEVWHNWTPIVRESGAAIGNVQLTVLEDGTALLGYLFLRPWWGRGYGREACAAVVDWITRSSGIRRVVAEIDPRNTRSVALVTALGFILAGVSKDAVILKGETVDEASYELAVDALPYPY